MGRLKILILDSDEIWRRGLHRILGDWDRCEVCAQTSSPAKALKMMASLEPDVVAVEAALNADTMRAIHRSRPSAGVLVFISVEREERDEEIEGAVRTGARAVATKSDSPETIRRAVEAVADDEAYLSPLASVIALHRYLGLSRESRLRELTPRERQVVLLLADGKSRRELAESLDITVKTVENHRANAMRKLGARSTADLVRAAIQDGAIRS